MVRELKELTFQANFSCFIGVCAIVVGEAVMVREDSGGCYQLWREDDDKPIARLSPNDVNKLAGRKITEPSFSATPPGVSSAPGE